jgi:hypothetical protein
MLAAQYWIQSIVFVLYPGHELRSRRQRQETRECICWPLLEIANRSFSMSLSFSLLDHVLDFFSFVSVLCPPHQ